MAYYRPLKNLKGAQTAYAAYFFSWEPSAYEGQMHYLWIYKEDELHMPQMFKYGQCIGNRIEVNFQYSTLSMLEVQKVRFLIFVSDVPSVPSREELAMMSRQPDFLCEICCGKANLQWNWINEKTGTTLKIISDKIIPEGFVYFEYVYGNKRFQYEIPGIIQNGENDYKNIWFPELMSEPQLKSKVKNLTLQKNMKKSGEAGGFFDKIAEIFR